VREDAAELIAQALDASANERRRRIDVCQYGSLKMTASLPVSSDALTTLPVLNCTTLFSGAALDEPYPSQGKMNLACSCRTR